MVGKKTNVEHIYTIGIHEYQQLQEDFEDIKDMLEAITEDDWVDFDEVIKQREQQDVQNSNKEKIIRGKN